VPPSGDAGAALVSGLERWQQPEPRASEAERAAPAMRRDAIFRRGLAVADLAAAAGTLLVVDAVHHGDIVPLALLAVLLIVPVAKLLGRYDREQLVLRKSTLEEFPSLVGLAGAFALTWSALVAIAPPRHVSEHAALVWVTATVLLTLTRSIARSFARVLGPDERVLIVGNDTARTRLTHSVAADPGARLDVVGYLPFEQDTSDPEDALTLLDINRVVEALRVERVLLVPPKEDHERMLDAIRQITAAGVKLSVVPSLLDVVGSAVEFDTVGGVTVLGVRQPGLTRSSQLIKRAVDVLGAGIGLILFSPLLLVTAVAIKLDSAGPVFFRQARVGREGRTFHMIKFRSMVDGAEAQRAALEALNETDGLFKISSDPRVTRIGRFIRSASIDELPQLFNVVLGEMSLVGPRPLVLDEDRLIEGHHRARLLMAPGMTGPWQVLGPTRPPLSEMVKTDYLYAANWSLWSDIKIMVRTFAHVSARRGV
jgi:exopolysaccharide biosynthesis polyprenyl glycosylphosphotransferase